MAKYLISYDLEDPGQNYDSLHEELERLGGARVLYSQWVTEQVGITAAHLRDQLKAFLDRNDRILVVCLDSQDWAGWNLMAQINSL